MREGGVVKRGEARRRAAERGCCAARERGAPVGPLADVEPASNLPQNRVPLFLSKADVRKILREEGRPFLESLNNLATAIERLVMTQAELTAKLDMFVTQVTKAHTEITTKLKELMDAIEAQPVNAEVQRAVERLATAIQAQDDIIPDAPPPAPENPA